MKLSVIVVARNQEKYLGECIWSIYASNFTDDFEVILIDDHSDDDLHYRDFAFKTLTYYRNKRQIGIAASCNIALEMAKGEYVVRVDGDDTIESTLLYLHSLVLDSNENIDFVVSDHNLTGSRTGKARVSKNDISTLLACGYTYRKDMLMSIGGYNDLIYEEHDLHLRLLTSGYRAFYLPLFLYNYRKHDSNMSNDKSILERGYSQLLEVYSKNVLNAYGIILD